MIEEIKMNRYYWFSSPYMNFHTKEIKFNPEIVYIYEEIKEYHRGKPVIPPKITKKVSGKFWNEKLENVLKNIEDLGLNYKRCFDEIKNPEF